VHIETIGGAERNGFHSNSSNSKGKLEHYVWAEIK